MYQSHNNLIHVATTEDALPWHSATGPISVRLTNDYLFWALPVVLTTGLPFSKPLHGRNLKCSQKMMNDLPQTLHALPNKTSNLPQKTKKLLR